jgi:hypothetical protein
VRSALAAGEALALAAGEGLGEGPNLLLPTAEAIGEVANVAAAMHVRMVIRRVYFIFWVSYVKRHWPRQQGYSVLFVDLLREPNECNPCFGISPGIGARLIGN